MGSPLCDLPALRVRSPVRDEGSAGQRGGDIINQRATRWLFNSAARLAYYRSYRDEQSREAMRQRGLDTSQDPVYPDLVFGVPAPPYTPGDPETVGVGIMAYYGNNDDRKRGR